MAFIPSETLSEVLERAGTGLWFDPLIDGRIALICKVTETAAKALLAGAECSLRLSVVQAEKMSILCLGIRIEDEPQSPLTIMIPKLLPRELMRIATLAEA